MKSIRESAGFQLAVLFGSFFILLLLSGFITFTVSGSGTEDERTGLLIGAIAQNILAFCVPAFLLARFSSDSPTKWLGLTTAPGIKNLTGVLIVYVLSLPAMEWLIDWNANLHLPESMSSLETLLRGWEEQSETATKILLNSQGWLSMLWGVLVIGILTGFSEELFFRGGLEGILMRTSMGIGGAVWLAAFIFSFMHFQFFGFVPRLIMGVFFGYLLIWTRSIWVPVFAHALNNSVVVVAASIFGREVTLLDAESGSIGGMLLPLLSLILTACFFIFYRKIFFYSRQTIWPRKAAQPLSEK